VNAWTASGPAELLPWISSVMFVFAVLVLAVGFEM
jgi:hypothetical protein